MKSGLFMLIVAIAFVSTLAAQEKLDALLVYGKDFKFSVKEPKGWSGNTESAHLFQANILLSPSGRRLDSADGVIRVRVNEKVDENTQEDIAQDMADYKERYKAIQFRNISMEHLAYRTYAKLFFVQGDFYEYVVYVNPGPRSKFIFSVSINKQKKEASEQELVAFREVVKSLTMF